VSRSVPANEEGTLFRFRCHTGHAYSLESLLTDITDKMDDALWNSIRAFEEGELFMRLMAEHLGQATSTTPPNPFSKAQTRRDDELG
jgi:hypothetical protein